MFTKVPGKCKYTPGYGSGCEVTTREYTSEKEGYKSPIFWAVYGII